MTQTNEKVRSSLPFGGGISMSGPGTMPWMIKAPNRIAMMTLAGTPKAMVVIKLPPSVELFAAPGPSTPSTSAFAKALLVGRALYRMCIGKPLGRRRPHAGNDRNKSTEGAATDHQPPMAEGIFDPLMTPPSFPTFCLAMLVPNTASSMVSGIA